MTAKINSGEGSIGKLINDPAFAQNLSEVTANFRTLTSGLNEVRARWGSS